MSAAPPVAGVEVREAFAALADLFCYPDVSISVRVSRAREALRGLDDSTCRSLDDFADAIGALDARDVQWVYTSTFDLAPSCNPYLGAHLFGDESRERARLMVGLRQRYIAADGPDAVSHELPDHVAVVLAFALRFDDDEWADLGRLVLAPALAKMDELLRHTANPYRHLVVAARQLAAMAFLEGGPV